MGDLFGKRLGETTGSDAIEEFSDEPVDFFEPTRKRTGRIKKAYAAPPKSETFVAPAWLTDPTLLPKRPPSAR